MNIKIKEIREERNLSQSDLAARVKTNQSNISRWESGVSEPSAGYLVAIADALACSLDELTGRTDYVTGNIEIIGEILTEKESDILGVFRRLSLSQQTVALNILCAAFPNVNK